MKLLFFIIFFLLPSVVIANKIDACEKASHNPLWTFISNTHDIQPSSIDDGFPLPEPALVNSVVFGFDLLTSYLLAEDQPYDTKARAMYTAASLGRLKTTALLISSGISPNSVIKENGNITPLFGAVQYGCNNEVRYLIKMGADINKTTDANFTLLELAISEYNYDTAILLLNKGYLPTLSEKAKIKLILERQGNSDEFDRIFCMINCY